MRHLRMHGAYAEQRNAEGKTALDVALENALVVEGDNAEVVAALRDEVKDEEQ